MSLKFNSLAEIAAHGFDTVIDVRSPAEFATDHVPGAISLPVLDNDERAQVGTIYVQQSPFLARKLGAALVFRNAANHIEHRLSHHEGGWRPLVYCWRGGQRSGSFAWMLQQIGWRADVIDGGYKSYRRLVQHYLYEDALPHRFVVLDGYTGTAKTALLARLSAQGAQVLDLEGLANHRGSLLGAQPGGQPSQKGFESGIAGVLSAFDPGRVVLVEAESSKIGERIVPPSLWTAMCAAPRFEIVASMETRTRYLVEAYHEILSDRARLRARLQPLRHHRGHAVVDGWEALIDVDDRVALTRLLMEQHYDPAYDKSRRANAAHTVSQVRLQSTDDAALALAAQQIADLADQF